MSKANARDDEIAGLRRALATIENWDRADIANPTGDVRHRMGKLAREALAVAGFAADPAG